MSDLQAAIPVIKTLMEMGFGLVSFIALLGFMYWYIVRLGPRFERIEHTVSVLVENNTRSTDANARSNSAIADVLHKVSEVLMVHDEKVAALKSDITAVKGNVETIQYDMPKRDSINQLQIAVNDVARDISEVCGKL